MARHYCINNYRFWHEKYTSEKSGKMYSDDDFNLFPRYNALSGILEEILMIVDKKFKTINECKDELITIGEYSQHFLNENITNNIANNAINEERIKFIEFLNNISGNDLINVERLPFIKKLDKKESKDIRDKLKQIWNFTGSYWEHSNNREETIFLMEKYISEKDKKGIVEYISKFDTLYYETDELLYVYETEELNLNGNETIYTNLNYNWIIYISHEMYIAFWGKMLLDYLNILFSDRNDKINKYEW